MLFLKHPAWLWIKKRAKHLLPPVDPALQTRFDEGHAFEPYAEAHFPDVVCLGKSGGGNSYGYDVVRKINNDGTFSTSEKTINQSEAAVIQRVFDEYINGSSPRAIAFGLNQNGIPGPRGKTWGASPLHGNVQRGTGILNNELYIGRLVWNRLRNIKDPDTGKRVSRLNPEADWITIDTPDLRIVDQESWDVAKAIQGPKALPKRTYVGRAMGKARRAKYLISGLLKCGQCGGGMSVISQTHIGCSTARNKGTCPNRKSIARAKVEDRVLGALSHQLMDPELFKIFCEEFIAETNRLRSTSQTSLGTKEADLAKTNHALDRLVQALIDGAPASTVKDKMAGLEVRKAELENALKSAPPLQPVLHPNMSDLYHSKVSNLANALNAPEARAEAAEALRSLIDKVVLTPTEDGYDINLHGDLAGILALASEPKAKTAEAVLQISLVAGVGFEPTTFRL
ncbi:recombinase family protein [Shimia thalassica]|uniref:recombinase family protein n=1 Tax=Shimia thalassica TaxID=1715693 RepID=UPI003D6631AA